MYSRGTRFLSKEKKLLTTLEMIKKQRKPNFCIDFGEITAPINAPMNNNPAIEGHTTL